MAYMKDDPVEQLIAQRNNLLELAHRAQRCGDLTEYSKLSHDADLVWQSIEEWESEQGHS